MNRRVKLSLSPERFHIDKVNHYHPYAKAKLMDKKRVEISEEALYQAQQQKSEAQTQRINKEIGRMETKLGRTQFSRKFVHDFGKEAEQMQGRLCQFRSFDQPNLHRAGSPTSRFMSPPTSPTNRKFKPKTVRGCHERIADIISENCSDHLSQHSRLRRKLSKRRLTLRQNIKKVKKSWQKLVDKRPTREMIRDIIQDDYVDK